MFLIRGIVFSHETVRDWEAKLTPTLAEELRRRRCGKVGKSWYTDETYIKVHGHWCYLYRAIGVFDLVDQRLQVSCSLGNNVAIFRQVSPQSVDTLRPLSHQHVASSEHDPACLLRFIFYRNKSHARPLCCLTDRLGIGRVVLLPLHERLDIGGRYQPDCVAQPPNLPTPVMRPSTRLHRHKTTRLGRKNSISFPRVIFRRNKTCPVASAPCA
jgi:hypothetical protein